MRDIVLFESLVIFCYRVLLLLQPFFSPAIQIGGACKGHSDDPINGIGLSGPRKSALRKGVKIVKQNRL